MPTFHQLPFHNVENIDDSFSDDNDQSVVNPIPSIDDLSNKKCSLLNFDDDRYINGCEIDPLFENVYLEVENKCRYYFEDTLSIDVNNFSIFCHNINSIPKHFDELVTMLMNNQKLNFDVLTFCETKLTNDIMQLYNIDDYLMFNNNTSRHSGGLLLYIKDKYNNAFQRNDLMVNCNSTESLFIEIPNEKNNVVVGTIYRRPGSNIEEFFSKLNHIMDILKSERKIVYITGDFNLNLFNIDSDENVVNLVSIFTSSNFVCTISNPTRVTSSTSNLLDHIWTNNGSNLVDCGILHNTISDHFPIFSVFNNNEQQEIFDKKTLQYNDVNDTNLINLKNDLFDVCWDLVFNTNNVRVAYSNFILIFKSLFLKHCPLIERTVTGRHINKQYITAEIKQLIKRKNKLAKLYAKYPITYENTYKDFRNKLTSEIRNSKRKYYEEKLTESNNNPSKTWKTINHLLRRKCNNKVQTEFVIDNNLVNNKESIANNFNKHFSEIGMKLANQLPDPQIDFHEYLGDRNQLNFTFDIITEDEITEIIKDIGNCSPGHDELSMRVLRFVVDAVITPLTHICNLSLMSGVMPDDLKIAKIVPIYKSKEKNNMNNYRPISILPTIAKIIEKVVCSQFTCFIDNCNMLTSYQHGFRAGRSTETALSTFVNSVLDGFGSSEITIGVFLDFSKAFDTVDHDILLAKLEHWGVRGVQLRWFESYLTNRKIRVRYNEFDSSMRSLNCSVPQGSSLGPLLFLIYINDIVYSSNKLQFLLYADDSVIFLRGKNATEIINTLNFELSHIKNWLISNRLTLNTDKSHYISFSSQPIIGPQLPLKIDDKIIINLYETKFLGVTLNHNLKWNKHIRQLTLKVNKLSAILYLTRNVINRKTLRQIYLSLIYPLLMYCNSLWGNTYTSALKPLVTSHKRIIRTITFSSRYTHSAPLFKELGIFNLNEINTYCAAIYVFKSIHNLMFSNDNYIFAVDIHCRNMRDPLRLRVPRFTATQRQQSIMYHGATIWNSFPVEIRNSLTLLSFKNKIKAFIHSSD